jgi:hypothetical protein
MVEVVGAESVGASYFLKLSHLQIFGSGSAARAHISAALVVLSADSQ